MFKKDDNILAASVTAKMKAAWSGQYGKGKCARVKAIAETDGEIVTKTCYLRSPSRTEMGAYSIAYRENPVKANEYLAKQCWLAGDPEILTDDKFFYAVAEKLPELIESAAAELDMF